MYSIYSIPSQSAMVCLCKLQLSSVKQHAHAYTSLWFTYLLTSLESQIGHNRAHRQKHEQFTYPWEATGEPQQCE
jgi:hypothetical protein